MLLQGLYEFYQRAVTPMPGGEPLIEDPAFVRKFVRWRIPVDTNGNLIGNGLIETPPPKKQGIELSLPRTTRPKNAGGVADFLWGNAEAVFGILLKTDPPQFLKNQSDIFRDFWRQIEAASAEPGLEFLKALLEFRDRYILPEDADLIQFAPLKESEKPRLVVRIASGEMAAIGSDNFTFEIDGLLPLNYPAVREYWKRIFAAETETSIGNAKRGACLVTGTRNVPISASHMPKISGVPGAISTGAAIVSFDKDAFCSYGFDQSHNSPVSIPAVEAYTNGLNYLLRSDRHRIRIGPAALVFWAQQTENATDLFADLFNSPNEDSIRNFMKTPFTGMSPESDPEHERFYSVVLSGTGGRVVIRSWMQSTVAAAVENFRRWFNDLDLVRNPKYKNETGNPLAIYSLAASTVRDKKDIRAETVTQLFRAALEGVAPSMTIAQSIVARIAIDLARDGQKKLANYPRYALLRLIINRNKKENEPMIEPSLTVDTDDPAYNCGRLLAVFDHLQAQAHENKLEGAGVVERYYGTASSSPNSAFGILWRLHQHHLKKLSRGNPAAAAAIKKRIAQLAAQFRPTGPNSPPAFPRVFGLAEQGRFALGFYQQWAAMNAERDARKAKKEMESEGGEINE